MAWKLKRNMYLTIDEWMILRTSLQERANEDKARGRKSGIRLWAMIDFAYQTGFRVGELVDVKIGDLDLKRKPAGVWVQSLKKRGKEENDPSFVQIGKEGAKHLKEFLKFKAWVREPTGKGDYLFVNKSGKKYSTRGPQKLFKEALKRAGLPSGPRRKGAEGGFSFHSLRHSCGTRLYQHTKDLRLVQDHLRHENFETTKIYAGVTTEDVTAAVNGAFNFDDEEVDK